MAESQLRQTTDKVFWHKYMPFYAEVLKDISNSDEFDILEVGVFNSHSIYQWRQLFQNANITGCDIIANPDWYTDQKINYLQFDQSDVRALERSIKNLKDPRILVDDGSHVPFHQLIFLHVATSTILQFPKNTKRVVIIEDLHTSLEQILSEKIRSPARSLFSNTIKSSPTNYNVYQSLTSALNPFGLLLSLEKVKNNSQSEDELLHQIRVKLKSSELFMLAQDIVKNCLQAERIRIYRRTTLPDSCWKCGSNLFDLSTLNCQRCGEDGFKHADSITAALEFNCQNTTASNN